VEVAGRTVAEAREAALDQLGVAEGDAEVIVMSEPRAGLFGRLRGEARVRARVRPVGPRPKRARRPRERSKGPAGGGGGRRDAAPAAKDEDGGDATKVASRSPGGSERSGSSRSRTQRRSRGRGSGGASSVAGDGAGAGGRSGSGSKEDETMAEGMTLEEQAEVARKFLGGLIDQLGLDARLETRVIDDETVEVAATGDGLGVLVGPRGATLLALQDVTRTVVQRNFPTRTDRILVDVAGYREKRAAALRRFSEQVAAEVLETGDERALEPMSPADRKVVHDAINEIDGVATRSEGEDPGRYVVVSVSA
jgi:spoIIIJ-associated protein